MKRLLKFEIEHLELIKPREEQFLSTEHIRRGSVIADAHLSFTITDEDDIILMCGGVVELQKNVGEVWIVVSDCFDELGNTKLIYSHLHNTLNMIAPFYHRVQMNVRADFSDAQRFAEKLGFYKEGIMVKYDSNKNDYFRYARLN